MIKEKLSKLIDLKSLITIMMSVALIIGFFTNKIPTEQFVPFATMVFMFYFQKKSDNDFNGRG